MLLLNFHSHYIESAPQSSDSPGNSFFLHSLTGYGPRSRVKKLRVAWAVSETNMAMSHEKIFANIPQLTSEKDWLVWKFQLQHVLRAAGQWEFITGTADAEAEDYESKKQKAFYSVLQCVGQKFMPMVMSCQTPKDMWDALCQCFKQKLSESGGSEVALKSAHKFGSKKWKAGNCFNCGQPGHFA